MQSSGSTQHVAKAKVVGSMPPYWEVAEAIWCKGVDFDSDGDSFPAESTSWRELTVSLRPEQNQRLDVDPISEDRDIVRIVGTEDWILNAACEFLVGQGSLEIIQA